MSNDPRRDALLAVALLQAQEEERLRLEEEEEEEEELRRQEEEEEEERRARYDTEDDEPTPSRPHSTRPSGAEVVIVAGVTAIVVAGAYVYAGGRALGRAVHRKFTKKT